MLYACVAHSCASTKYISDKEFQNCFITFYFIIQDLLKSFLKKIYFRVLLTPLCRMFIMIFKITAFNISHSPEMFMMIFKTTAVSTTL